ncbi:MAG: hypothetical protein JO129_00275 [Candidatus Dependentiae bacterium]|nr:hypothetical protein [Candidatus Dependentiae bacterium]
MNIKLKRLWLFIIFSLQVSQSLALCQAFFTPQDDITSIFINMINAEQKTIWGAIYMFTDKKIAQALVDAKKRGVDVQLIIDQISMSTCGKGKFLQDNGVPVIVHKTEEFNPYTMALMHHKFFIFGCNKDRKSLVWTGSWNCTLRATQHNDENVIVIDDWLIIKKYADQFMLMRKKLTGTKYILEDWFQ